MVRVALVLIKGATMAADLVKLVSGLRDDLKALYLENPTAIWDLPVIAFARKSGGVNILEGIKDNEHVVAWLRSNLVNEVESIAVGRMVIKPSTVLGADGKPVIKEKAILVTGRNIDTKRTYVSITPCKEHRDYRSDQFAEKQNKTFDPTLKGADKTKNIENEHGRVVGRLQAKFGPEQVLDSKKGNQFMVDPIIAGVYPDVERRAEDIIAENLNASTVDKIKDIL